ncbi:MAG: hypothetical protein Tsb005_06030 [Gammaproteobacteria bacterium]
MRIKFHGKHTTEEALANLISVFELFKEQYGVADFSAMTLKLNLLNEIGEPVELVDLNTSEILDVFEVYQAEVNGESATHHLKSKADDKPTSAKSHLDIPYLRLVVDNT